MQIINQKIKKVDEVIGKQPYPHGLRDSDGDKVINILDCEPYNKHKQGMIHNIAAKAVTKKRAKPFVVVNGKKYYRK